MVCNLIFFKSQAVVFVQFHLLSKFHCISREWWKGPLSNLWLSSLRSGRDCQSWSGTICHLLLRSLLLSKDSFQSCTFWLGKYKTIACSWILAIYSQLAEGLFIDDQPYFWLLVIKPPSTFSSTSYHVQNIYGF